MDLVIRTGPGDFGCSLSALGDVEVDGVLEGVGVLSDSSESLTNWDLPRLWKVFGGTNQILFEISVCNSSKLF